MDEVLKKNGIYRAAMFGGTIEGNGARKLMENADAIINEMKEHVLQSPTRFAGTDEQICHVGKPIATYFIVLMASFPRYGQNAST
jgi:hypothetical protein